MKNRLIQDKKGGEKIFSIWWFFVLAVVGLGIVTGVLIFYSADVDVREVEAGILYERIVDCLIEQGFLSDDLLKEDFDIFSECKLNKNILNNGDFYIRIQVLDKIENKIREEISIGNNAFYQDCEIILSNDQLKAEKLPKCIRKTEGVLYYDNNEIKKAKIEILTASNQKGIEVST